MSTRTKISLGATDILKDLEKRTRLTPNILARIAIALSLEDSSPLPPSDTDHGGLELNHTTLYGEHEAIYMHLAMQWADRTKDPAKILGHHLERGVGLLRTLLATHSLADLADVRVTQRALARQYVTGKEAVS